MSADPTVSLDSRSRPVRRSSTMGAPNSAHSLPTLPSPEPLANPSFVWGSLRADDFIQSVSCAYSEVVHWKRNTFNVPYGNTGKKFVYELSSLYRAYAESSALECIAMKAITVMSILLLQRPHSKSKPKEHSSCLERRLQSWSEGDLNILLLEGRTLQNRFPKPHPSENSNAKLARAFSNLMFQGKTNAALQLLSQRGNGGILHIHDPVNRSDPDLLSVFDTLKSKHPRLSWPPLILSHCSPWMSLKSTQSFLTGLMQAAFVWPLFTPRVPLGLLESMPIAGEGSASPSSPPLRIFAIPSRKLPEDFVHHL